MKLIISGGSGLVATEVIRQSLLIPRITSLVVLSRRPISVPDNKDAAKLTQVLIDDYEKYSEDVKSQLAGASACIWTVAITPTKSKTYAFEEVRRVCHTCTIAGLKAITDAGTQKPFRFVYMSGDAANEEQVQNPRFMPEYVKLRFETDQTVRALVKQESEHNEVCIARSGLVTSRVNALRAVWGSLLSWTNVVPNLTIEEVSAAMLDGVLNGFEAEALQNEDLKRIGQRALQSGFGTSQ